MKNRGQVGRDDTPVQGTLMKVETYCLGPLSSEKILQDSRSQGWDYSGEETAVSDGGVEGN